VLLSSGGVEYALSELEKSASEGPTEENQKIVEFIFQNWHKTSSLEDCVFDFCPSYEVPTMTQNEIATRLAGIAVQSNDAKLWTRTMGMCKFRDGVDLSRFGLEHVVAGWERFQLEDIEAA
jgi:Zn-finger protein